MSLLRDSGLKTYLSQLYKKEEEKYYKPEGVAQFFQLQVLWLTTWETGTLDLIISYQWELEVKENTVSPKVYGAVSLCDAKISVIKL